MTDELQFAIPIPQLVPDGGFDPVGYRSYLRRAEELGFASAWTMEVVLGPTPFMSPIEAMVYAAACTERIRLGCAVFVTPLHNPVHLAKSLATLDQLSGGRLEVGVGTGGKNRVFSAFEVDPSRLVTRFNEGLDLMKALWTQPQVTVDGHFWQLSDATAEPKPLQTPHPPIWVGASHPNALARAARHGDGFFGSGSTTTARFAEQVPLVRQALQAADRDPAGFRIAKRVFLAVSEDVEQARQRVADSLVGIYGDFGRSLEPAALVGPPSACVAGLRDVAAAGAELILVHPLFDQAEQMERLAAEVLPELR